MVVGLGNPGPKYDGTRHNVGFALIDLMSKTFNFKLKEFKYQSVYGVTKIEGINVAFVKPLTYMNLSGQAVVQISHRYQIPHSKILVVTDDLDLPVGQIRYREKGGAGGHNGHKSLIQSLKTEEYPRLKIGIGKPIDKPVDRFVLEKFTFDESLVLNPLLDQGAQIVQTWIKKGSLGVNNLLSSSLRLK